MNRLRFSLLVCLISIVSGCFEHHDLVISSSKNIGALPANKTNVVLILIDDLSHYGMSTYGSNVIRSIEGDFPDVKFETPSIDKLAQEGVRIERAFTHPLCENTRVALMSGKQNNRNYLKPKSLHHSDITFGDIFKKAGFTTGLFGKWKQTRGTKDILGKDYISEFGWDDYAAFDVVTEGQRFINPNLVINGEIVNYEGRQDLDPETGRRWYGPDIFNRHALKFIEKNKNNPFFLYYSMALVHDDHKPTPDTLPKSIFDNFDEVPHNKKGHKGDDPKYIADMIKYTDKMVAKIVDKLDELKLRENTLIIIMGDNGTKEIFAHVLPDGTIYPGRKGGNADNGLHVGMVVNQPSIVQSLPNDVRTYDGLVYLTDILPTIAEAAGVPIPKETKLDGVSFWPQILGQTIEHRNNIYSWYIANNEYDDKKIPRFAEFAFNKDFKYYAPNQEFPQGRFFDLRSDLLERTGDRYITVKFNVRRYSGLPLNSLTEEQYQGYQELKQVITDNAIVPIEKLTITATKTNLIVGEKLDFDTQLTPINTTRSGVIWQSSDPRVASVNKFGEVTAHSVGKVILRVFSWSDAKPIANGYSTGLKTDGISDEVELVVDKLNQ